MPWLFTQLGNLYHREASASWEHASVGMAGQGGGLNNPAWQAVKNFGPLPIGTYTMVPVDVPRLGPVVFRLDPAAGNNMYGRSSFYIHWQRAGAEESSSEGCIVLFFLSIFKTLQESIKKGDNQICVVSAEPDRAAPPK